VVAVLRACVAISASDEGEQQSRQREAEEKYRPIAPIEAKEPPRRCHARGHVTLLAVQRDTPISCKSLSLKPIRSLRERARYRHSARPCFTWVQRKRRERTVVPFRLTVLMAHSTLENSNQIYSCPVVRDVIRNTHLRLFHKWLDLHGFIEPWRWLRWKFL
jgi:hypothetical protein